MIDLPQVVDVISNPNGSSLLERDARNVASWFTARGLPDANPETLTALLKAEAGLT
jgi:RIO kinase 1